MTEKPTACVFTATHPIEADVVVSWLAAHDIPSRVINQGPLSVLGPVPWTSVAKSATGFEVWVTDEGRVQEARELVTAHEEEQNRRKQSEGMPPEIVAVHCENCGADVRFPVSAAGHVEVCPVCKQYVDVPESAPNTVQLDPDPPPM